MVRNNLVNILIVSPDRMSCMVGRRGGNCGRRPVRLFRVRYRSKKGRSCAEKAIRVCEPAANLPRVRPGRYRIMHKKAGKESDSSRFCLYLFHNDQIKIDMEKLLEQINDRIAAFQKDAYLQWFKGNKAAGRRARKAALELMTLLKEFRKASLEAGR